ncbi:hypothetical protein ASF40_18590 [Microbacterium sp. Leaf288]|uniref:DUF2510 domain-containing protein n=1 Tax=Microbacterium sp. Leaf288 TaxID=1736323 RepID=UPI0006F92A07|nr:DUF2510 domain-containing protein [Microbacterium sp. Leaf288]KQP68187.1 hypothetical protein ASF40_18590 [Microbacterium sp. Leaf288]
MTTTPPGWYDDGHGANRWWDGTRWTERVAGTDAAPAASPAVPGAAVHGVQHDGATVTAVAAPPEPKSSRWIVWVVIGAVVLVALIGAAVAIPLLTLAASRVGGLAGEDTPVDADQKAAVAAVELYDDAWQDADCQAFMASTTEAFRAQAGLADCSAFETEAEGFGLAVEDYEVDLTGVRRSDEAIVVSTTETYSRLVGEDGNPLDEPVDESIDWEYTVVADGDDWVIDSLE